MHMKKLKLYFISTIIALILIPFIIGKMIIIPCYLGEIAGNPADLLLFWGTYIGALATAIMAWLTYKILCLNERLMKSQEEMKKGVLDFSLIELKNNLICLRIENVGLSNVKDISYKFNSEFLKCLPNEVQDYISNQGKMGLRLNSSAHRDYPIYFNVPKSAKILGKAISIEDSQRIISEINNIDIQITGSYITQMNEYIIDEKFKSENYLTNSIIEDNEIAIELKSITKGLTDIKASLDAKKNKNGKDNC